MLIKGDFYFVFHIEPIKRELIRINYVMNGKLVYLFSENSLLS